MVILSVEIMRILDEAWGSLLSNLYYRHGIITDTSFIILFKRGKHDWKN
jgi:hypothetical protein